MLMYGKEASNRKQEIDRQHYTIPNQRPKDKHAFIEEIRKYAAIKELDEVVLNRLIKKIMIGEVQKVDGQKIQEVKIIYNFVGEISA